mgnify:FL=1
MSESLYDFCQQYDQQYLLEEWDDEKNLPLTPDGVTHGSHTVAWWRCGRDHSWQAAIYSRTMGSGCPYCSGKKVQLGFNDLASQFPDIAAQWDVEKNAPTRPCDVASGSHRAVWWRCEKGHSWHAIIRSRVAGCGCPVCAGRLVVPGENDLASLYPELMQEWDTEKNGTLTPQQVTASSNRKAWWRCRLGHSYVAVIASRTGRGTGCPYCMNRKVLCGFNDLATLEPEVAREWHPTLNGALTPDKVTAGSHRRVWWQCANGHVWKALIYSRAGVQKCGCPVCAGKVRQPRRADNGRGLAV